MDKSWKNMSEEAKRQLKIERFGYDPTVKSLFLGAIVVDENEKNWAGQRQWYEFYLKADDSIDICYHGCNGTSIQGRFDPADGTTSLSPLFDAAFFKLLENHKQGNEPPKRPEEEIQQEVDALMENI